MRDWDSPIRSPYVFLIVGVFLCLVGVASTCTGKTSSRYRWVYRAKEPKDFWWTVAIYYLAGVFFIGCFLYQVYEP